LLRVLEEKLQGQEEIKTCPGELCGEMEQELHLTKISPARIAQILRRLRFPRLGHGRRGAEYQITLDHIKEVRERYTPQVTVTLSQSQNRHSVSAVN